MKTKEEIIKLYMRELDKIDDVNIRREIEASYIPPILIDIGWNYAATEARLKCWLVLVLGIIKEKKFGVVYSENGTDEQDFLWSIVNLSDLSFGRYLWFSSLLDAYEDWSACQGLIYPSSSEEVAGAEFEWFVVDGNGDIAVFSTAGFGFVPEVVFDVTRNHALLEGYLTRTHFGRCIAVPRKDTVPNEYLKRISERGLYAFEWSVRKGLYKMVYVPESPLNIAEVDPEIAKILELLRLDKINWKDSLNIKTDEIVIGSCS